MLTTTKWYLFAVLVVLAGCATPSHRVAIPDTRAIDAEAKRLHPRTSFRHWQPTSVPETRPSALPRALAW